MKRERNMGLFCGREISPQDGNSKFVSYPFSRPYCLAVILYSWQTRCLNTNKIRLVAMTLYHVCLLSSVD